MPEASSIIRLISVAVGQTTVIGTNRQGEVLSGIRKREIVAPEVVVRFLNIEGDRQADLLVHGGVDKAIYCYPRAHRAWWRAETGYDRAEAPFGENLSVEGITEDEACIGDTWRWGTALLQVSQPRWPCFKLAMHTGVSDMIQRFADSGRCGWYLRVLEEGVAPTSGPIEIASRDPHGIGVRTALLARRGEADGVTFALVNEHPALANAWRR